MNSVVRHIAIDQVRRLSFIKLAPTALLNASDSGREIGLFYQFALLERLV